MIPFPYSRMLLNRRLSRSYEDLTTYTEVDASGLISVTSSRATATNLTRNNDAYIYKDFGVNHFSENIIVEFDTTVTTSSVAAGVMYPLIFANAITGNITSQSDAIFCGFFNDVGTLRFYIFERDAGTQYNAVYSTPSIGSTYYCRFVRDESVGANGTIYLYIASSAANRESGTWITTLSIAIHTSKKDYRYMYAMSGLNTGNAGITISGWAENFLKVSP